jgi:hypothetical protein
MANGIYNYAKQAYSFPNITTDNIKVALTRGYSPNFSSNQFLSDITGGGGTIVASSPNLSGKTWVGGLFNASGITFSAVPAGAACDHLVLYYDTGVPGSSVLLCALDSGFTGLPVTPDGSDIVVTWAAGGIFQL